MSLPPLPPTKLTRILADVTLREVRQLVDAEMDNGILCPCCSRNVKRYARPLYGAMVKTLCVALREFGTEWFYMEKLCTKLGMRSGDPAKMRHWGLIDKDEGGTRARPSGGSGWYRVAEWGRAFVDEEVSVPKHAYVYNNDFHGYSEDVVDVRAALGKRFDLDELMTGGA